MTIPRSSFTSRNISCTRRSIHLSSYRTEFYDYEELSISMLGSAHKASRRKWILLELWHRDSDLAEDTRELINGASDPFIHQRELWRRSLSIPAILLHSLSFEPTVRNYLGKTKVIIAASR